MTESVSSTSKKDKRTVAAFFSGVGGIELGFENTSKFRTVYANEFDKNARITYEINHPKTQLDGRDIHEVPADEVPESDIIVGGFPCQAFSIAGYRKGFEDDRGDLFFELLRIINENKPQAIFVENVKNMVTHDQGKTFMIIREALVMNGYNIKWKVMNGKDYGNIPQNRERIYIVGFKSKEAFNRFEFPGKIDLETKLSDVIDFSKEVEDRYYYKEGVQPFYDKLEADVKNKDSVYQWRRQYVRENKSGVVPTLTANMGTGGHNVPIILSKHGIRKLLPRETFNVQGFPKEFKLPEISNGQLYKQAGNSVVVPVITRIANNIAEALDGNIEAENVDTDKIKLMKTKMQGKFSGESEYILNESENEVTTIPFLDESDYLREIKKNKDLEFYSKLN